MEEPDDLIKIKAPGKLYIAGEYAVVDGMPAILVALNQYITAQIKLAKRSGTIVSKQYPNHVVHWRRRNRQIVFDHPKKPLCYILSAIKITEAYAKSLQIKPRLYDLKINSQLDSPDGKKYGLGSSAAVTVATVHALCNLYRIPVSKLQLFKLAAIAHFSVQGNGSLGDIATSVYGGWIAFRTFNHHWLTKMKTKLSINDLINQPWPHLKIKSLHAPKRLKLLIGWTGTPASTSQLVRQVEKGRQNHQSIYHSFLLSSKYCVLSMIKGFKTNSLALIKRQIMVNRDLLNHLGNLTNVKIETPKLKQLCQIVTECGGVAKSSGAGGGDCGIAIIDRTKPFQLILGRWRQNQILPLEFKVSNSPSREVKDD